MTDKELHGHLVDQQGSRGSLNTPVLVTDRAALDRNIAALARFAAGQAVSLRPHAKTHKSPEIARRQLAAGAISISCAKIGEAEVLADDGVRKGLLLTSPVVSVSAITRLAALNLRTDRLMCVVDTIENVDALGAAASRSGKRLRVIGDIDPGIHRTEVGSAEAAVALFRAIATEDGLHYSGVQFAAGCSSTSQASRRGAKPSPSGPTTSARSSTL